MTITAGSKRVKRVLLIGPVRARLDGTLSDNVDMLYQVQVLWFEGSKGERFR